MQSPSPRTDSKREEWIRIQNDLCKRLIVEDRHYWSLIPTAHSTPLRWIGGVDISFVKDSAEDACASLVVLSYPQLEVVYEACEMVKLREEYIPGFLAFREVEHILKLCHQLKDLQPEIFPEVIFVDGNGILHPRGLGLASHLGVLLDVPTIGVGKTFFDIDGLHERDVIQRARTVLKNSGDRFPLVGRSGKTYGMALRATKDSTNPIFVSVGHRLSIETATELTYSTCRFRVPQSIRLADLKSRNYIAQHFPK